MISVSGLARGEDWKEGVHGPREMAPPASRGVSWIDRPSKSSSTFPLGTPPLITADVAAAGAAAGCASSGPKSMRESSLPGPVETPAPLVPRVPFGIRAAPSRSPFLVSR